MKKHLTTFFLILAVMLWGTWFGGQLFNEAIVIPKWLSSPPESMRSYDAIPIKGGFFFFVINPFFTLVSFGYNIGMETGGYITTMASVNHIDWAYCFTGFNLLFGPAHSCPK